MELYRISQNNTQRLHLAPFSDELTDMESFIQQHPEILGNVIILDRQIHRGGKGRMDLLALDLEEKPRVQLFMTFHTFLPPPTFNTNSTNRRITRIRVICLFVEFVISI